VSWLRIAIFYVVAAGLTVHLLGIVAERAEVTATRTTSDEPFLEAVPERIDRVRMENDQLALQFEKRDGRWVTTEPEGIAPPGDVISAVIESLTTLPAIEIVSNGKDNEDQFGLVPPRMRIRLEQEGALVSTVVLGELSPTRTAVYARKSGSDDVALIGLNAKYYIDLVFENVRRQQSSAGVVTPPVVPPPAATPPAPGSLPAAIPPAAIPPAN
jgi:hypothetical protein